MTTRRRRAYVRTPASAAYERLGLIAARCCRDVRGFHLAFTLGFTQGLREASAGAIAGDSAVRIGELLLAAMAAGAGHDLASEPSAIHSSSARRRDGGSRSRKPSSATRSRRVTGKASGERGRRLRRKS